MRAVDTNVLARLILNDDEQQAVHAQAILAEPVWVARSVWLELGWVLSRQLKLERGLICDALEALLKVRTVHTDDPDGLLWAVERFRAGAEWADMIHLVTAKGAADEFVTFDRKIAKHAGANPPLPVSTRA